MESIYTELALYGSKNECARTDTVFLPISEVCDGTVSLTIGYGWHIFSDKASSIFAVNLMKVADT